MESTSTSSIQNTFKYDVFLSFRGEDTRKNFGDHLYHALMHKGIFTYRDYENIQKGKRIRDDLFKSIEDSKFYIIVFSKNYVSSSWCMDELVKIMECQTRDEHTAYPVFYDVEPTEVRKQTGAVGVAFEKHRDEKAARKWREALKEASDLAGFKLKSIAIGHEAKLIHEIIQKISVRFSNSSSDGDLIGMETRVNEVISSLEPGVGDVRMLGIWGMGGAGKTTLARAIFDQISIQFEGESFIENVREVSNASSEGLKKLQKQVLSDVLKDQNIEVSSVSGGKSMMQRRMCGRRILVVLDDVNHKDQLEALAGNCNWFKPGSRIIITTRDKQVLAAHGVRLIHNVTLLSQAEAGCLFSRHAFGSENPIQGYEELSGKILQYANGLPLTIKVMGSHLRDLDESQWKNAIKRLETIPVKDTMEVLELSLDGLDIDLKEIFLDVASILKGWKKEDAIRALECCGFHAIYGLRVLEQKSLITISESGHLGMHDHLEEMGRNIVRRSHPDEPQRHSRLWVKEEIEYILTNDLGTQATKCLYLQSSWGFSAEIAVKGLAKMKDLRFLHICLGKSNIVEFDKVSEYLPSSLRFMSWWGFPFSSLPNTFQGKYLVRLEMYESNIVQLWEDGEEKVLNNLRFLTIKYSRLRTFDLRLAPNLEQLTIYYCRDFIELHIPADHHSKLEHLVLSYSKLTNLHLGNTPNLKTLKLIDCNDLVELQLPPESPKLQYLDLTHSKLKTIDLRNSPNLEKLILKGCNDLAELQMPDESLELTLLDLSYSKLTNLHLRNTPNLNTLILEHCTELAELQMPAESVKLLSVNLNHSKLRTLDLGLTPTLELDLEDCYNSIKIDAPFGYLKKLVISSFCDCGRFKSFVFDKERDLCEVSSLFEPQIAEPRDVCELHRDNNFANFKFSCYYKEDAASSFRCLERLISVGLCACSNVESIFGSICSIRCLRKLTLEGSITEAPRDLDRLECLEELMFSSTKIRNLPDSICMLMHLKAIKLKSCWHLEKLPEDLGRLQCLEELDLTECIVLRDIPNSICQMKNLKYFYLPYCFLVEKLPEEIGSLKQLKELNIEGAGINHLPQSIFQLEGLRIVGFTWQLQSCGFTSMIQTSTYRSLSYIEK